MRYQFYLDLPRATLERYYAGLAGTVAVQDRVGRSIRFPAAALRPHVTHTGIRGWFELETDARHKLVDFRRLGQARYHGA